MRMCVSVSAFLHSYSGQLMQHGGSWSPREGAARAAESTALSFLLTTEHPH